jgi:hypothetical protein
MPVVHADPTDGYLAFNQNPTVVVERPLRRIDRPDAETSDALIINLNDLAPTSPTRAVYASWKGYVAFDRQSDGGHLRAFLMIEERTKDLFGGRLNRRGNRLTDGLDAGLHCVAYVELQNLDPDATRAALRQLIASAQATPTDSRSAWTLATQVASAAVAPPDEADAQPPTLAEWLETSSIDDYLNQYLLSDDTLAAFSAAFGAGQRPNAYGLRVNAGDAIGWAARAGATSGGATDNYRVAMKVWNEYRPAGVHSDSSLRSTSPGFLLNRIVEKRSRITFIGDVSSTNNLGVGTLFSMTASGTDYVPPTDDAKRSIHPLLWHISLDASGRDYGVFRLNSSTNRVQVQTLPLRITPATSSRTFQDLVAVYAAERFSNAAELNALFDHDSGGAQRTFAAWFQARLRGQPEWLRFNPRIGCCAGRPGTLGFPSDGPARFDIVWNHISDLFGTTSINLVQFACAAAMMIRETGGSFAPIRERGDLEYLFAYNDHASLNRNARSLFNDPLYLFAHGGLAPGAALAHTPDTVWEGDSYPAGYATDPDDTSVAFIAQADFNKFKGRGYIQTTGRTNFRKLAAHVLEYAGTNPVILGVRTRWEGKLASAQAAGIAITNRADAALTISICDDWEQLFEDRTLEFACIAFRLFFQTSSRQLLDYGPTTDPYRYVWDVSDKVSGAVCSIEANLLRVHSIVRELVDG